MLAVGDKVITKKKHPCGCDEWEITRVGADIKLKCLKCGHTVMMTSEDARKAVKKVKE